MITSINFIKLLNQLGFSKNENNCYEKIYASGCKIQIDESRKEIIYPEEAGLIINDKTTCNFSHNENFVVFECIDRLLSKGYRPEHIELEKKWTIGHEQKSGKADIVIYNEDRTSILAIIECKTFGYEYSNAMAKLKNDGGQLFSYWQQEKSTKWLILYASEFEEDKVLYKTESISCSDDPNLLELSKKDDSLLIYQKAHTAIDLFNVWNETYEKKMCGDVLFDQDTIAYKIGVKPLRKKDLKDFSTDDKIVNRFEEILRHNNVSDKENAFNRLIALFICKLVDEINKGPNDEVEFQYKVGTDTYESLQDRLQKLHQQGMDEFMKEKIFYIADDYAENLVKQYTNQRREKMIEELNKTIRILKFYSNNDFAFKDVHNEELFYQNGKVLVEVVQLFQEFRIIDSNSLQLLGDLFEQLLNKGFKQNEGQFFTPTPITRFIWKSIPVEKIVFQGDKTTYPKIIDYACGAGHFLTEGFEEINNVIRNKDIEITKDWVEKKLYGVEKDYRLARVSKISLFMHGAGNGNIIFGDGLECYPEKSIENNSFDILVANPPYSVSAFKPHLKLKNNDFEILKFISNDGSEIETLFVERIAQLVKPKGIAAVVLPSSILNKENNSFVGARESLLKNFIIRSIVQFGSKTFGATGTNTIVLFLEKYNEPPKRCEMVLDSIDAIFNCKDVCDFEDEEIINAYLERIRVEKDAYYNFISHTNKFTDYKDDEYFSKYYNEFIKSSDYQNKIKQKSFKKLSEEEQNAILNSIFYKYATDIEKEKLYYFALTYTQKVLIVNSPSENSEQEKFLGYKWSNRKGQEGIQIIKDGGMLYGDGILLSDLIKYQFSGIQEDSEELGNIYFFENLDRLMDYDSTKFIKSIKLTKVKKLKTDPKYTNYKLSDSNNFSLKIGNRVLSEEVVDDGEIPVYSANVYEEFGKINKNNLDDFSQPSILWGIDGDWMVNVIEANKPFYPTDHCGVLRINNPNINIKYMALALYYEGKQERFSRTNRASTERIKNLLIQIPPKPEQDDFVNRINEIDNKIVEFKEQIVKYDECIKSKFDEIINGNKACIIPILDVSTNIFAGGDRTNDISYTKNERYLYPIYSNGEKNGGLLAYSKFYTVEKDAVTISARGTIGYVEARKGKFTPVVRLITIIPNDKIKLLYLKYALKELEYERNGSGAGQLTVPEFKKMNIRYVDPTIQSKFVAYASKYDKLKFDAQQQITLLENEREKLIEEEYK